MPKLEKPKKPTMTAQWWLILQTPGPARTALVAQLAVWAIAAIWGWFFVEPTVLRDSQAARDFVDFATKIFPWLENIRRLVPQAEKGLYLHCVYTFALAPLGVIAVLGHVLSESGKMELAKLSLRDLLVGCGAFVILLYFGIWCMYSYILHPSYGGGLHRTGYSFVVSKLTVPITAAFFFTFFWGLFMSVLHLAYRTIRKFALMDSRNG